MLRIYTGDDVYNTAVRRIAELYEEGHTLVVSLSGGKDSGACLNLCIAAARAAKKLPVYSCIQDEEIAFPGTFEFVEKMARRPEVDFRWFVCNQPMVNIFNRRNPYFWVMDPLLKPEQWVRRAPEDLVISNPELNIESIVNPRWFPVKPGKFLIDVVGLRVQESAKRMLGLVSSGGHLTSTQQERGGVQFRKLRPIYDWTDDDIWKAHLEQGWEYNQAYDVMHRMGVPKKSLRIGPPTMTADSAELLKFASKAWPRWFERVCARLEGVRQAAQFGSLVARPRNRVGESWQECYQRVCIDNAPADWIRERAITLKNHMIELHSRHSNKPLPEETACPTCGGAQMGCWRRMTHVMFNGDPFSLRLASVAKQKFPYMEPEFFRPGAGTWNGTPHF